MRILFVGDVVGPRAVTWLAERLPRLRADHGADLVIVDAENAAENVEGMPVAAVERLFAAGADVVTGGNHAFDGSEVEAVLAMDRVLRPHNVGDAAPGRGVITVEAAGEPVRVVVLADGFAMDGRIVADAHPAFEALPDDGAAATIVEMHALSVMAKQSLAYALDGRVAAVLGTHTHEPTIDLHVLPGGTAFVADVGMTGPRGGVQGISARAVVDRMRGVPPERAAPVVAADGEIVLGAVLLDVEGGKTTAIRRVT